MKKKDLRTVSIYKKIRIIVSVSGALLAFLFSWLQFNDVSFQPFITDIFADIIYKTALSLYYFSWIFGINVDLNDEEYTFSVTPNKNKLTSGAILMMATLVIIFGFLCWVPTQKTLMLMLNIFFVFNIFGWKYLVNFIKPTFAENKKAVLNKFDCEYQKVLEEYLMGSWQIYRFVYGAVTIGLLNVIVFSDLHIFLSEITNTSSQFVVSFGLLFYIITFEILIWFKRLERKLIFKTFDRLDDIYILILQEDKIEPEE